MAMCRWRRKAHAVIVAALEEGRKNGLEGKELERHVSAAYPFGRRSMHPYKVWLNEFALLVRGERKLMAKSKKKGPKLVGHWPGEEPSLFGKDDA